MISLMHHQNSLPILLSLHLRRRCLLQTISALSHVNDGTDIGNEFLELYNAHVADLLHHDVRHRQLRYPSLVLMA
jgi:hypothetical protein